MRAGRAITVVGCHAGGEVGNVVVGGVLPPPGATVFEQMQALARDDSLRREPRGSVAQHANLILPPTREDCDAGFIVMEPTEYPPMSGSNAICVATGSRVSGRSRWTSRSAACGTRSPTRPRSA
jgi:trans-L-3-hydroxyproline dehydratase